MVNQDRRDFLKGGVMFGVGAVLKGISWPADEGKNLSDGQEMSIFDLFQKRRSVRSYTSTPVPEEHVEKIIDAARMAPTAGNQQPWKFLVIRDRAKLDALKEACITERLRIYKEQKKPMEEEVKELENRLKSTYGKVFSAPVFIVVLVDTQSKWPSYNEHDGPLAAGILMLAARALGYGTVYFTDSITDGVTREVLSIPDRYERICITPVGVPEEWPKTPPKKDLEEIVVYESF